MRARERLGTIATAILMSTTAAGCVDQPTSPPHVSASEASSSGGTPSCSPVQVSFGVIGSYDGTVDAQCNSAANAIGIASIEWGQGYDQYSLQEYRHHTGQGMWLFASQGCAFGSTQQWWYGMRVTLNDATTLVHWWQRPVCDPIQ